MGQVSAIDRGTAAHQVIILDGEIDDLKRAITLLEQQRTEKQASRDKAELTAKGIGPCDKCGRHVPSPCDNGEGYHEGGPWDGSCREYFNG